MPGSAQEICLQICEVDTIPVSPASGLESSPCPEPAMESCVLSSQSPLQRSLF